jgi:hypothetical protein
VQVPSIADLRGVFGDNPESVAEVSLGAMLPLDRWPEGEIRATAMMAGRTATVYINPNADLVRIEIEAAGPIVMLSFPNVQRVEARLDGPFQALSFTIGDRNAEQTFVLRTSPEIDFRSV